MACHQPVRGIMFARAEASPAEVIAELQTAFSTFKATQDEQLKGVKAKFDDVVTHDKLERVNAHVGELQAAIDAANVKLASIAVGAGADRPQRDAEYTDAFMAHFRRGDVQASLNKGTDSEGGYLAPVEWDRTITDKLVEVSQMRQIASVQAISRAGFTKLFNLRGTSSGWVGENASRPETNTPTFGEMTITPGEIYANPGATQGMLDDAEINLESWLAGEVQTKFAEEEGAAFVAGDGTNKPWGFLAFIAGASAASRNPLGSIEVKTAAGDATVTEDELLDLIYALPSAYTAGARFVMNRTTMGAIRKLRDSDGRQLWQPSSQAGQPAQLLAYPVSELPDMPDLAAEATPIAFGDFKRGYLIVDRTGVRVLRDPYTAKPKVLFYTTKRVGGAVVDPQAIKVLKMAAE